MLEEEGRKKKKNPVRLDIQLNDEQKEAKRIMLDHDISIITGLAGTGKSLLSAAVAFDQLLNNGYDKIIIARPYVIDESFGHVPGDIGDKFAGIMAALVENFKRVYGSNQTKLRKLTEYFDEGKIEHVPIGYMKGRTFTNSIIIIEEAEDVTPKQMKLILTRLGIKSKMFINGDLNQTSVKGNSGMQNLFNAEPNIERMCHITLTENHRASIVKDILQYFE
jgi:phosphate starvation-inducible PhoH-like protein